MIAIRLDSKLSTSEEVNAVEGLTESLSPTMVGNDHSADRIIWRMKKLQDKMNEREEVKKIAEDFYDGQIEKLQAQMDYHENILRNYMEAVQKKTLSTPNGTVRTTTRTRHIWSDIAEKDILGFCNDNNIPLRVKHSEEIDKKAVIEYIESTGDYPAGYRSERSTSFSCKYNNNTTTEE